MLQLCYGGRSTWRQTRSDGSLLMIPSRRHSGLAARVRSPVVIIAAAFVVGLSALALALLTTERVERTYGRSPALEEGPGGVQVSNEATPPSALTVKANATVNVRTWPSKNSQVLGTLRRGQELDILGRSSDSEWVLIAYPPRSQQRGWIPTSAIDRQDSVYALPTVTPTSHLGIEVPMMAIPSATVRPTILETPVPTATPSPLPERSPAPSPTNGGPDLSAATPPASSTPSPVPTATPRGAGAATPTPVPTATSVPSATAPPPRVPWSGVTPAASPTPSQLRPSPTMQVGPNVER